MPGLCRPLSHRGDAKRRSYEDSSGRHNLLWDQENLLVETDSGGSTVARYTPAPELHGALVSQRRSGATPFHHFDALGSTRALTNAGQTVTDTRDYRAFGLTNTTSGSNPNRFWWKGNWGYYSQPDPGTIWVRARIEVPSNGRMLSRDLMPDGRFLPTLLQRLYAYAGNSPTDFVDPTGLFCWKIGSDCFGTTCHGDPNCPSQYRPQPSPIPGVPSIPGTPVPGPNASQQETIDWLCRMLCGPTVGKAMPCEVACGLLPKIPAYRVARDLCKRICTGLPGMKKFTCEGFCKGMRLQLCDWGSCKKKWKRSEDCDCCCDKACPSDKNKLENDSCKLWCQWNVGW